MCIKVVEFGQRVFESYTRPRPSRNVGVVIDSADGRGGFIPDLTTDESRLARAAVPGKMR